MQGTYGVDNIILDLDIVDVNAVDTVLCRPYYFRTCDCRPNSKRNCRPKSVELMDGSLFQWEACTWYKLFGTIVIKQSVYYQ